MVTLWRLCRHEPGLNFVEVLTLFCQSVGRPKFGRAGSISKFLKFLLNDRPKFDNVDDEVCRRWGRSRPNFKQPCFKVWSTLRRPKVDTFGVDEVDGDDLTVQSLDGGGVDGPK